MKRFIVPLLITVAVGVGGYYLLQSKSSSPSKKRVLPTIYQVGFRYQSIDQYCDTFEIPITDVDRATFTIINDGLAYDKENIYYLKQTLENSGEKDQLQSLHDSLIKHYRNNLIDGDQATWNNEEIQILDLESNYARDEHHLYYGIQPIKIVDSKHVQMLGDQLYRDDQFLYIQDQKLEIDPSELTILPHHYFKDQTRVFYRTDSGLIISLKTVHAPSFEVINETFSRDKSHYYYYGIALPNIDYKSFEPFEYHALDKNRGYYFPSPTEVILMRSIDFKTFEPISRYYSRDKNYAYFEAERIPNIDPTSLKKNQFGVVVDKNSVLNGIETIPNADPTTFQALTLSYDIGKSELYYDWVDPDDNEYFEVINDYAYARDDRTLYYQSANHYQPITTISNPDLFELISGYYATDQTYIYAIHAGEHHPLKNVDAKSFSYIGLGYFKDKDHLYYHADTPIYSAPIIVETADPKTFQLMGTPELNHEAIFAQDQNHCYQYGEISACPDDSKTKLIEQSSTEITNQNKDEETL